MRKQYHFWPGTDGLDAWDVDRLIQLSRDLPVHEVEVSSLRDMDSVYWFDDVTLPTVRNVVVHMRLVQEVDPSYPIILSSDGRVMDGMHRVARAHLKGQPTIKALRFEDDPEPDYLNCRPQDLPYD